MQENTDTTSDFKEAYNYAIYLISKMDYSVFKMTQKLKSRKYLAETIDPLIQKLLDQDDIREPQYIRMRTKQLLVKGYANSYIVQKLRQEKLSTNFEEIDSLRSEFSISSDNELERLIEKKLRGKTVPKEYEPRQKLKVKVMNFLKSKGYDYSDITTKVEKYFYESYEH